MNLAGKYLSIAQGVAESALLASLRAKYKLNINLVSLANEAKQELAERGLNYNPSNFLAVADDMAGRIATYYDDTVGLEQQRWNPKINDYETYVVQDPRRYFIR